MGLDLRELRYGLNERGHSLRPGLGVTGRQALGWRASTTGPPALYRGEEREGWAGRYGMEYHGASSGEGHAVTFSFLLPERSRGKVSDSCLSGPPPHRARPGEGKRSPALPLPLPSSAVIGRPGRRWGFPYRCRWAGRDSNPHGSSPRGPKPRASASSATGPLFSVEGMKGLSPEAGPGPSIPVQF